MNKKYIRIILAFILSCSIAYLIGQKVVVPLTDKKSEQSDQKEQHDNQQTDEEVYDLIMHFPDLLLTGQSTADDNPWGSNLTAFEDEEHGTCILMMPGTEISAKYKLQGEEILSWSANIHPWMVKISDGVGLDIAVKTVGTDVSGITEQIVIVPTDTYEQGNLSLAEFQDTEVKITLSVNNGDNDDSSGDWLVFDKLVIQSAAD